jgi:hypothetical protein
VVDGMLAIKLLHGQGLKSWNLLINNMIAYLEKRDTVEEF